MSFITIRAVRNTMQAQNNADMNVQFVNECRQIIASYERTFDFRSGYIKDMGYFNLVTLYGGRNWYLYETDLEGSVIITCPATQELLEVLNSMDSAVDYMIEYQDTLIQKDEKEIISLLESADARFKKALGEEQILDAIRRIAGLKYTKPCGIISKEDIKEALLLSGASSLKNLRVQKCSF